MNTQDLQSQFMELQKAYGGEFKYDENGNIISLTPDHVKTVKKEFTEKSRTTKNGIEEFLLYNSDSASCFELFYEYKDQLIPKVYWHGLATTYIRSDNFYGYKQEVRNCFMANIPERNHLMNRNEKKYLSSLGERVTIHRAMSNVEYLLGQYGLSWTLDYKVAEFFQKKYNRNGDTQKTIETKTIDVNEIIAVFLSRDESEVIVL